MPMKKNQQLLLYFDIGGDAEATGNFLFHHNHLQLTLDKVVVKGNLGVMEKAEERNLMESKAFRQWIRSDVKMIIKITRYQCNRLF
ncbi:hypothetical protein D3C74_132610 [compost metagenome]